MKNLKKLNTLLLTLIMIFAVTACSKEVTKTYEGDYDGSHWKYIYTAKNDKITKSVDIETIKYADIQITTDEQKQQFGKLIDDEIAKYNKVKGVKSSKQENGDGISITTEIDYTVANIHELIDSGLLLIEGDAKNGLSLKKTEEGLIKDGFKEVK